MRYEKYPIYMNAFQMGLLTGLIVKDAKNDDDRETVEALRSVMNQINDYYEKWRREK